MNVNSFYQWLDDSQEELVVCSAEKHEMEYRENELNDEIENRANEYISWEVFGEERNLLDDDDALPEHYDGDIWAYVRHHVLALCKRKPTWYELRSITTYK